VKQYSFRSQKVAGIQVAKSGKMSALPEARGAYSPFMRKMVQLEKLRYKYKSVLAEFEHEEQFIREVCERLLLYTADDTGKSIDRMYVSCSEETDVIFKDYAEAFGKLIREFEVDFRTYVKIDAERIEQVRKTAELALRDLQITVSEIGHRAATASNAMDTQCKLVQREFSDKVSEIEEKFQEMPGQQSRPRRETCVIRPKEADLPTVTRKARHSMSKQHKSQKRKKIKRIAGMKLLQEHLKDLQNDIANMKNSLQVMVTTNRNHFKEIRKRSAETHATIADLATLEDSDVHSTPSYIALNDECRKNINDLMAAKAELIQRQKLKWEDLSLALAVTRESHRKELPVKVFETDNIIEEAQQSILEFCDAIEKKTRAAKEEYDLNRAKIEEKVGNLSSELSALRSSVAEIMESFRTGSYKETASERAQESQLKSVYLKEEEDLAQINARERDELKVSIASAKEKRGVEASRLQKQIDDLRVELWLASSAEPEDIGEDQIPEWTPIDILEVRSELDTVSTSRSEQSINMTRDLSGRYSGEYSARNRRLDASYEIQMQGILAAANLSAEDVADVEMEFKERYEQYQQELEAIGEIRTDSESFEKSERMIESLSHECFQLKSFVKFQRTTLISDWEEKIGKERVRFEEESLEFSRNCPTFHGVLDLQRKLQDAKHECSLQVRELEQRLAVLSAENENIWRAFEQSKEVISKELEITNLKTILEETEAGSHLIVVDAESRLNARIVELNNLREQAEGAFKDQAALLSGRKDHTLAAHQEVIRKWKLGFGENMSKLESEIGAYQRRDIVKQQRAEYERRIHDINRQIKEETVRNKTQANERFSEFNARLSEINVAINDSARLKREKIGELKNQLRGVMGLLTEKLNVAENERNQKRDIFTMQGPRAVEQEQIDHLEKILNSITAKLGACTKEYGKMKRSIDPQYVDSSRSCGQPKATRLRRGFISVRSSLS
jgi:uncharacterized protein YgiM (DUF1202 family)